MSGHLKTAFAHMVTEKSFTSLKVLLFIINIIFRADLKFRVFFLIFSLLTQNFFSELTENLNKYAVSCESLSNEFVLHFTVKLWTLLFSHSSLLMAPLFKKHRLHNSEFKLFEYFAIKFWSTKSFFYQIWPRLGIKISHLGFGTLVKQFFKENIA